MARTLLLDKITVQYSPRTSGNGDPSKKEELRDKLLDAFKRSNMDLENLTKRCRNAKNLSLDVVYRIFHGSEVEGRERKDLDNMLKILLDVLPERFSVQDKSKQREGLGLIAGEDDTKIFEIHCAKKKVYEENEEGLELAIFQLDEADVLFKESQ